MPTEFIYYTQTADSDSRFGFHNPLEEKIVHTVSAGKVEEATANGCKIEIHDRGEEAVIIHKTASGDTNLYSYNIAPHRPGHFRIPQTWKIGEKEIIFHEIRFISEA